MSEAIAPPFILKTVDGITIVTFTGPKVGTEAREELYRLMETQGNRKLILNFENVRSLSSAPIGMLVNLMNKAASAGGAVRFCQLDPDVQDIMRPHASRGPVRDFRKRAGCERLVLESMIYFPRP